MKSYLAISLAFFWLSFGPANTNAEFTSLYTFGDGLCSTTDNTAGTSYFCGQRYCNGRVWVELLTEWQGLDYDAAKNWSYFGHDSSDMIRNVEAFGAPTNAATSLFIVWAVNADFVEQVFADPPPFIPSAWTNMVNNSLANHGTIVSNLYAKGVRTLVMPSASDVTTAPFFGWPPSDAAFVRSQVEFFNTHFTILTSNLVSSLSGLTIYIPDTFSFVDDLLADPTSYGVTNTTSYAIIDHFPPALDGPGAEYLFWDDTHVSARGQLHLAELVQKMISPVEIESIIHADGTNHLTGINMPVGWGGVVDGSSNLMHWTSDHVFTTTKSTQTIPVSAAAAARYYRLRFPIDYTDSLCP